jgi:hypothetical protein
MDYWQFHDEWFSVKLPKNWAEYEDEKDTFAFFNTDEWTGNLRITPMTFTNKEEEKKAEKYIKEEAIENNGAVITKVREWEAAFYTKSLSDGNFMYYWVTGIGNQIFICSFTTDQGFLNTKKHEEELLIVKDILNSLQINRA